MIGAVCFFTTHRKNNIEKFQEIITTHFRDRLYFPEALGIDWKYTFLDEKKQFIAIALIRSPNSYATSDNTKEVEIAKIWCKKDTTISRYLFEFEFVNCNPFEGCYALTVKDFQSYEREIAIQMRTLAINAMKDGVTQMTTLLNEMETPSVELDPKGDQFVKDDDFDKYRKQYQELCEIYEKSNLKYISEVYRRTNFNIKVIGKLEGDEELDVMGKKIDDVRENADKKLKQIENEIEEIASAIRARRGKIRNEMQAQFTEMVNSAILQYKKQHQKVPTMSLLNKYKEKLLTDIFMANSYYNDVKELKKQIKRLNKPTITPEEDVELYELKQKLAEKEKSYSSYEQDLLKSIPCQLHEKCRDFRFEKSHLKFDYKASDFLEKWRIFSDWYERKISISDSPATRRPRK